MVYVHNLDHVLNNILNNIPFIEIIFPLYLRLFNCNHLISYLNRGLEAKEQTLFQKSLTSTHPVKPC